MTKYHTDHVAARRAVERLRDVTESLLLAQGDLEAARKPVANLIPKD